MEELSAILPKEIILKLRKITTTRTTNEFNTKLFDDIFKTALSMEDKIDPAIKAVKYVRNKINENHIPKERDAFEIILEKYLIGFKENPQENKHENFKIFFARFFTDEILDFDTFKVYLNVYRHILIEQKKDGIISEICDIIENSLKEQNFTKESFLKSLDDEEVPTALYELDDGDEIYRFYPKNYQKLNIEVEAQDICQKFKIFLENIDNEEPENFNLKTIVNCSEEKIQKCANLLFQQVLKNSNSLKFSKIVQNFVNSPKTCAGVIAHQKNFGLFYKHLFDLIIKKAKKLSCRHIFEHQEIGTEIENFATFAEELIKMKILSSDDFDDDIVDYGKLLCHDCFTSVRRLKYISRLGTQPEPEICEHISQPGMAKVVIDNENPHGAGLLRNLELFITHISSPFFTEEHMQVMLEQMRVLVYMTDEESVKIYFQKASEFIHNFIEYNFSSNDSIISKKKFGRSFDKYIFLICKFYNYSLIKEEDFDKFLITIYKRTKEDHCTVLMKSFMFIMENCYSKIVKNFNEEFPKLYNYADELKTEKIFKEKYENEQDIALKTAYADSLPKIIAEKYVYECKKQNSFLKSIKINKVSLDATLRIGLSMICNDIDTLFKQNENVNAFFKSFFKNIFVGKVTRRGVAKIHQMIAKYEKCDKIYSELQEMCLEWTYEYFMGKKPLPEDAKDIFEVILKIQNNEQNSDRVKEIVEKILQNHQKNLQKKTKKIIKQTSHQQRDADKKDFENFIRTAPFNLALEFISDSQVKEMLKIKGKNETEKILRESIIAIAQSERQFYFDWRKICMENPSHALTLLVLLIFKKVEVSSENLKTCKTFVDKIREKVRNCDKKKKKRNSKKKERKNSENESNENEEMENLETDELTIVIRKLIRDNNLKNIELDEKFTTESFIDKLLENFNDEFLAFIISTLKSKKLDEILERKWKEKFFELANVEEDLRAACNVNSLQNDQKLTVLSEKSFHLSKMNLIKFVIFILNFPSQEAVLINFVKNFHSKFLLLKSPSENARFAMKVLMHVIGKSFENLKNEDLVILFAHSKFISKKEKNCHAEIFNSICNLRDNDWKIEFDFENENFNYDELMIEFHLNEKTIDKFIAEFWKFLLESDFNESHLKLIENCTKIHANFIPKLTNFMSSRCLTFQNLPMEFLYKEKVQNKLGKVSVFVTELFRMKIICEFDFTRFLTLDLIDEIPSKFIMKINEILARTELSEEQLLCDNLKRQISYLEMIQNVENAKKIDEIKNVIEADSNLLTISIFFNLIYMIYIGAC
ncbi:hypothetical protein PVAND_017509 [Polypedilum vanderplanki]|uniref:Uncharacterized protein n=1 Tax=Polypedilum vanderplanki TaxID=319348 RepID=A0A9J6BIW5_POLVA|nr:hypothetical protein PVAND_017509 [Polypedilum vanderplanki]